MRRTTVYLPESTKRRLARTARQRGTSEAALIRDAIEQLLGAAPPRPTLPLFDSGRPGVADAVDDELDRLAFGQLAAAPAGHEPTPQHEPTPHSGRPSDGGRQPPEGGHPSDDGPRPMDGRHRDREQP